MTDDKTPDLFAQTISKFSRQITEFVELTNAKAAAGRDKGISKAEAHAASEHAQWPELAAGYLDRFMRFSCSLQGGRFQTTHFRHWAEVQGLPSPPDPRAYGGIIRRAAKAGRIVADGYACKPDESSHACPAVVWRVVK